MKRAGNLMEKIYDFDNLYNAYYKACRGKLCKSSVQKYSNDLSKNINTLRNELISRKISVGNYHYFQIYDPKLRQICAADFGERVLHHSIMNICHPYFERNLIFDTYATRIGKGTYCAIDKGRYAAKKYEYVAKLDMRKYFDSISHIILKDKLRRLFKDQSLLSLFDLIIDSYESSPGKGIPIGNLTSQYFANYYLSSLDHYAKEVAKIPVYIRYMDDILLFGNSHKEINEYVQAVIKYASEKDELEVKPPIISKTEKGISFLGYVIYKNKLLLNKRSKMRLKSKMNTYLSLFESNRWSEMIFYNHITPLLSFANKAYTKNLRKVIIEGRSNRVLRGGSWNNNTRNCRVSNRNNNNPDNRNNNNGLRLALLP